MKRILYTLQTPHLGFLIGVVLGAGLYAVLVFAGLVHLSPAPDAAWLTWRAA